MDALGDLGGKFLWSLLMRQGSRKAVFSISLSVVLLSSSGIKCSKKRLTASNVQSLLRLLIGFDLIARKSEQLPGEPWAGSGARLPQGSQGDADVWRAEPSCQCLPVTLVVPSNCHLVPCWLESKGSKAEISDSILYVEQGGLTFAWKNNGNNVYTINLPRNDLWFCKKNGL